MFTSVSKLRLMLLSNVTVAFCSTTYALNPQRKSEIQLNTERLEFKVIFVTVFYISYATRICPKNRRVQQQFTFQHFNIWVLNVFSNVTDY